LAGFFAIVISKQVFGGIGQNLFNPAMLARVSAAGVVSGRDDHCGSSRARCFPVQSPGLLDRTGDHFSAAFPIVDAVSGATILGHVRTQLMLMHQTLGQILPEHYHRPASRMRSATTGGSHRRNRRGSGWRWAAGCGCCGDG
jgi:electron transport complex protein RnfD